MMDKTNDELHVTTPAEPTCGLEAERPEYKIIPDDNDNGYTASIRQASTTAKKKDEHRKPEKRNGCIGNWLDRMARVNRQTFGDCGPKCGCGK